MIFRHGVGRHLGFDLQRLLTTESINQLINYFIVTRQLKSWITQSHKK